MLNIYIARHGQDVDNERGILNGRRDSPLTKTGINQAKVVSKKLTNLDISFEAIYTSPLKRAILTAEIISKSQSGTKPIVMDELIERDFGIMTGKKHTEIELLCSPNIIRTSTCTYFLNPYGSETFPQLRIRAKRVIDQIKNKHKKGNILLVTHGDIGKMIYASYHHLDWKVALMQFHFGNAEVVLLSRKLDLMNPIMVELEQFNL